MLPDDETPNDTAFHKEVIRPLFKLQAILLLGIVAFLLLVSEVCYLAAECVTCSSTKLEKCDFQNQFAGSGPLTIHVHSGAELHLLLNGERLQRRPSAPSESSDDPPAPDAPDPCMTGNVSLGLRNSTNPGEGGETFLDIATNRWIFPCGVLYLNTSIAPRTLSIFSDFSSLSNVTLNAFLASSSSVNISQDGTLSQTAITDSLFADLVVQGPAPTFFYNVSVPKGVVAAYGQDILRSTGLTASKVDMKSNGKIFMDMKPPLGESLCSLTVEPYSPTTYSPGHYLCIPYESVLNQTVKLYNRWTSGKIGIYFYNLSSEAPEDEEKYKAYITADLISCETSANAATVFSDIDCSYGSIKTRIRPVGNVLPALDCENPGIDLKNRGEISLVLWAGRKPQKCKATQEA